MDLCWDLGSSKLLHEALLRQLALPKVYSKASSASVLETLGAVRDGVNNLEPAFGLSVVQLAMGNSGSRLTFSRGNGLHLDVRSF